MFAQANGKLVLLHPQETFSVFTKKKLFSIVTSVTNTSHFSVVIYVIFTNWDRMQLDFSCLD